MDFSKLDKEVLTTYAIEYGTNIVGAILIFFIGRIVAGLLTSLLRKIMVRAKMDQTLVSFLGNIAFAMMITFVIIASIDQLGVDTTSLAAVLAAAGLAVGLALQGSLSNFASGVMIILFRPFKIGDFIAVGGVEGTVKDITIYTTILTTGDNKTVIIPNSKLTSDTVINFSTQSTRRVDLVFGISYDDDIKKAKKILNKIVESDERILKDPAPLVAMFELADSSVNFKVRPWVNKADYWDVYHDLHEKVKTEFDKNDISIPYPQRDVHLHTVDSKKAA